MDEREISSNKRGISCRAQKYWVFFLKNPGVLFAISVNRQNHILFLALQLLLQSGWRTPSIHSSANKNGGKFNFPLSLLSLLLYPYLLSPKTLSLQEISSHNNSIQIPQWASPLSPSRQHHGGRQETQSKSIRQLLTAYSWVDFSWFSLVFFFLGRLSPECTLASQTVLC